MFRKTLRRGALWLAILLPAAVSAVDTTAWHAQRRGSAGPSPLSATLIKTGLYMLSGEGNSLLRLSANGLIVVDGQEPAHHTALQQQVRRISEQPIRLLITTDHHPEHTASNKLFLADGVQILAQDNVKRRLADASVNGAPIGLPTKTYDRDFSLTLGGVHVRVMHFGRAHTDGDSVVYFPDLKVVAVGDLFAARPDPDFSAGGSMVGWGPVLAEILKLDFDVVVPAKGPTVTRADLIAYKAKLDTLISKASALVKQGLPKDQLLAQLKTADFGWHLDWTGERVQRFYTELFRRQ